MHSLSRPTRFALAALLLVVYGAGASWVVSRQARSYREGLRSRFPDPPQVAAVSAAEPVEPAKAPDVVVETARPSTTGSVASSENVAEVAHPGAKAAEPKTEAASAPPIIPLEAAKAAEPGPDPVWDHPDVKKVWKLDQMTLDDERRYGQTLNSLILLFNGKSENEESRDRVQLAAKVVLEQARRQGKLRKGLDYTFTVLVSDEPNVFSIPGGFVYVTEGMLRAIPRDQEYALQFALAHEMAHVELDHALACMRSTDMLKLPDHGTIKLHYCVVIPFAYLDDQDFAADRWALDCMGPGGLGLDLRESLMFLRKISHLAKQHNFLSGRAPINLESDRSPIANHLRAHVSIVTRLKKASAYLEAKAAPGPR